MGFLDKAKSRIPSSFGDETVRVVNYGKEREEEPQKPKAEKPQRPERAPKEPRQRQPKVARPSRPVRQKPEPEEEVAEEKHEFTSYDDSAFALDQEQENFYSSQQEVYKEAQEERRQDLEDVTVSENKIQDVLEVLQIPATFAIESDVFLPEDIEDVVFDLQAPFGFEQGQVTTFTERTKVSVKRYVELLRLRNEHVAKLASVIDRLQVDANNLRFQNEISSGINVMPTIDSEDLENQLLEARLKIKRLEDQIRTIEHGDDLSSAERKTFEDLQDNFSILQRENNDLQEEIYMLKTQLAYYEEADEESTASSKPAEEALGGLSSSHLLEEENEAADFDLPMIDEDVIDSGPSTKPSPSSAFYVEEDDDEAFATSAIELIGDDYSTSSASSIMSEEDDDEDDALDALMRDWKNQ